MTIREHIEDILSCWKDEIFMRVDAGEERNVALAVALRGTLVPEVRLRLPSEGAAKTDTPEKDI